MSAGWLSAVDVVQTSQRDFVAAEAQTTRPAPGWSPGRFARDQIRGLVRQVFSLTGVRPMRQIVFSAIDLESEIGGICRRVGETLAQERGREVAVVGRWNGLLKEDRGDRSLAELGNRLRGAPLKQLAARIGQNCWLVPAGKYVTAKSLQVGLAEIRKEFEYSIVAAPAAAESGEAMAMAQFADGLVLVLSAQNTRRATARRIKQVVDEAHVRLLGVVLADREFPMPEALYRRL